MSRVPSHMSNSLVTVPQTHIPRSTFNRSHGYKTTLNTSFLYPVYWDEVVPGDTFNLKMTSFVRLNPMLAPLMDNLKMDTHFFYVPYRLVWDNFQRFMGEQKNPGDSTDFLVPQVVTTTGFTEGSIYDYFGLPLGGIDPANPLKVSALPFRAYNLIYNEWYRDQNLQQSAVVNTGDGPDAAGDVFLRKRGAPHDYFTSALPWPQKGPSVPIPLSGTVNVSTTGSTTSRVGVYNNTTLSQNVLDTSGAYASLSTGLAAQAPLVTDLSAAANATINMLRTAFQMQRMYERDARGGTRFNELILSHFGVQTGDARVQRPEYLGGSSTNVNIQPITQTSESGTTPQGTLTGIGQASNTGTGFVKSFVEPGIILGLVSIRGDMTYQQNIERFWSRRTKYDFYWPTLAHLGEQPILNQEIWYSTSKAQDEAVFGYQERYAEYRFKNSMVTSAFRSDNVSGSLDYWHLAQDYSTTPVLANVIQDNTPLGRAMAVPSEEYFLFDSYFDLKCARPMPVYAIPGLVDHL